MAADPAWVTELSKAENDALRQAVPTDVQGILDKYSAPAGAAAWSDAPLDQFFATIQNNEWLSGLPNNETNAFTDTHTVAGEVTLSIAGTRTALLGSTGWTQAMTDALTATYLVQAQRLFETLGLANVGKTGIQAALKEITDTTLYADQHRYDLLQSIRSKSKAGALDTTSTVNLETIDSILGV